MTEMTFSGRSLRAAREMAGLSREQLATAVTRTAKTVAEWETGKGRPRQATVFAIARALRCRPSDLMADK
jgi:transcriptional regulator with XRE-family HTH domain